MHRFLFAVEAEHTFTWFAACGWQTLRGSFDALKKAGQTAPPAPLLEWAEGAAAVPSPIEQSPVPWYTIME